MGESMATTDELYRERARLVAFVAALFPSVLAYSDPAAPDFGVVTIKGTCGQMTWHISPRDFDLFAHVPHVDPNHKLAGWDGHDTITKYERLAEMVNVVNMLGALSQVDNYFKLAELAEEVLQVLDVRSPWPLIPEFRSRLQALKP